MFGFLNNVRIIEIGHILLAPYATQFMGDFGADVIKVESLDGDIYRNLGLGREPGMTAQWMAVNRNKRSIALDLKSPEGHAALLDMIRQADVVVHNMRVPAIERLGLGYDALCKVNPEIIYCAAIGFGQDGPYADHPAFDDLIQAQSGLADINGKVAGRPALAPVVIADMIGALTLGQAMLAGLNRKSRTGKGCYIENPMFETMVAAVMNQHLNGHSYRPEIDGLGYKRVMSPYRHPSRTRDGYIVHGVYKYDQWQSFLAAVGRQDILDGPLMKDQAAMFAGIADLYELASKEILPNRTTDQWYAFFEELGIPSAPVNTLEDLENDPHLQAVGLFEDYEHPTRGPMRQVRAPFTVKGVDQEPDRYPPELGEHGAEVLRSFGFTEDRITTLQKAGTLAGTLAGPKK